MDSVEVRELQEELSRLTSLKEHAGFRYLMEVAKAQVEGRQAQVLLTPLQRMDDVLQQEFAKGEVSGIKLFMELTEIRIRDLREEISERLKEDGPEQSDE